MVKRGYEVSAELFAPRLHHFLLLFTVLGEGRARRLRQSVSFSISDSKTQWFRLIFSQNQALASLGASWLAWGLWVPPGCLLGASWVPPGCLLGDSWVSPGCLLAAFASLGASWVAWGLWVPSGCFLGASWVPPGWLLGVSWMPPGCFLGMSWVASGESSSRLPCSLLQDC